VAYIPRFALQVLADDVNNGTINYDKLDDNWRRQLDTIGYTPPPPKPTPAPGSDIPGEGSPEIKRLASELFIDAPVAPPAQAQPEPSRPFFKQIANFVKNPMNEIRYFNQKSNAQYEPIRQELYPQLYPKPGTPQPQGSWFNRAGQAGSEVMGMMDRPDKVTTGSKFGDITADFAGNIMGFAGNPASAGAKLWGGTEHAISGALPLIPKLNVLPQIAQTGLKVGMTTLPYEATRALANDRPFNLGEAGTAAASNALLGMLLHGGGKALESLRRPGGVPGAESTLPIPEVSPGVDTAPQKPFTSLRLPGTEKAAMDRLNEGIQTAQNFVKHNDVLAAYPPGTTVEAALADIKANTGIDLPKLMNDVEAIQGRPGLRQQAANEAQFSRLGQAAGAIPEPTKLVGPGRERILGGTPPEGAVPSVVADNAITGVGGRGILPQGISPIRRIPEKMEPLANGQRVRSLGVSAAKAEGTPPEVQRGLINEMVPGGQGAYDVHSNERTIQLADRIINTDVRQAERFVRENPGTDLSNTVALKLVQKANAEGRFEDATDLIQNISQTATTQGQAIQSLRLWGKMTPEGMQKHYVKTISSINRDLENTSGKLTQKIQVKPEIMGDIKTRMEQIGSMSDGRDKDIAIAKTLDLIAAQVPVPFLRKVASIQTMAQLLNPKTAIRNIVGNFGFAGMENVSGVVGAGVDKALSLATGQRTKVLPSLGAQAKGFKQGWKHGLEDALLGVDTSGLTGKFDIPLGRTFRKGPLGFAEKALNIELRASDRAFYQGAYEESLLNQMRAAKVNAPTEEMRNVAHLDGLYKTFQDDNGLSKLFVGIKQLLNKVTGSKEFGAGDFIVKYPRTPANLLMRGIDYSPAGFVKTILEAARPLVKQQFNQKAFVESFSRALVGSTALFGTGALLHKLGIITGRPPEDRDLAELNREQGFGEYRLNASALKRLVFGGDTKTQKGDTIVSFDWFQPQAIPLAIGADVDANKGSAAGLAGTILQALGTGINAFADQPVVQGIQTLFGGGYGNAEQGLIKVLEGVPASFIPTLLNQVKQLSDNQRRETYDPNKTQEALNRVGNKIPGLAGNLPVKYGTLGQPLETYQGGSNGPFNVFLNPAFTNQYNPSREVGMVNKIYEQTGETSQIPRVMPKKITVSGKSFVLTGQEYADYQRLVGELTQKGFARMSENMKPAEAAKRMKDVMSDANEAAKTQILKARGERVYKKGGGIAVRK